MPDYTKPIRMKFSVALTRAIEYLAEDHVDYQTREKAQRFSCNAIERVLQPWIDASDRAFERDDWEENDLIEKHICQYRARIEKYLHEMGLDCDSSYQFGEFEKRVLDLWRQCTAKSQRARALWLTWAAMIAKEEGK